MKNKTLTSVIMGICGGFVSNLIMTIQCIMAGNGYYPFYLFLLQIVFPIFAIWYKKPNVMQALLRDVLIIVVNIVITFARSFSGFNEWFYPFVCQNYGDDDNALGIILYFHIIAFVVTLIITTLIRIIVCLYKKNQTK